MAIEEGEEGEGGLQGGGGKEGTVEQTKKPAQLLEQARRKKSCTGSPSVIGIPPNDLYEVDSRAKRV